MNHIQNSIKAKLYSLPLNNLMNDNYRISILYPPEEYFQTHTSTTIIFDDVEYRINGTIYNHRNKCNKCNKCNRYNKCNKRIQYVQYHIIQMHIITKYCQISRNYSKILIRYGI